MLQNASKLCTKCFLNTDVFHLLVILKQCCTFALEKMTREEYIHSDNESDVCLLCR